MTGSAEGTHARLNGRTTSVFVADHDELWRLLVERTVARHAGLTLAGSANEGASARAAVAALRPGILVVAEDLPCCDVPVWTRELRDGGSATRVVVLCRVMDDERDQLARVDGAAGCLPRSVTSAELKQALLRVATGGMLGR